MAFDAEESGSYGSQELIRNMIIPYYVRNGVNIQVGIQEIVKKVDNFRQRRMYFNLLNLTF